MVAATTKRRLNDGQLKKWWLFLPCTLFLITGISITFTALHGLQWLLIFPLLISSILLTYPSRKRYKYIMGYFGPVDLSKNASKQPIRNSRIEPTLAGDGVESNNLSISGGKFSEQTYGSTQADEDSYITNELHDSQSDLGEQIRHALVQNKNAVIALSSIFTIVLLGIFVSIVVKSPGQDNTSLNEPAVIKPELVREHTLLMPDDFTLQLTKYKGLIISWQTQSASEDILWDQKTIEGDIGCSAIEFNNGDKIRTIDVVVEQDAFHFAQFSPLDTAKIVSSLAKRGNFKLCDYKFSLKGSQAALGKNSVYADYLSY